MFNYTKLEELIKQSGKTKSYLCAKLGRPPYYLRDVVRQKNNIPLEYQQILADELGTTVAYLNDESEHGNLFWDRFVGLCARSGKAPNTVARELGIPSGSITAWKNGVTPRNATILRIAEYFGVSVEALIAEQSEQKDSFYSRFEALRESKGISKAFIADALGRTRSICNDWKLGKSTPNTKQLEIVAQILDTTPEYLLGETDNEKSTPCAEVLNDKERRMLKIFRSWPEEQQLLILALYDKQG